MSGRVNFKFECSEDFNAMSCTERGRFCNACQREVIDFTETRIQDIQALSASGKEVCGIFRPDQIDPNLYPIQIPQQVKALAFFSSIFLWLGTSNASAQSTVDPKFEQSEGVSNAPQLSPEEVRRHLEKGQTPISMTIGKPVEIVATKPSSYAPPTSRKEIRISKRKMKRYSKKWYWSKRFPFLHKRRFRAGKF